MLKECVIKIWIPRQGFVRQGKFCLIDNKPCFIANMTQAKWFRNFGGYGIAKRVLDALPRGTKIIFKRVDLNQYYITNRTKFIKKGIGGSWGNHSQYVLPLTRKNWIFKEGKLEGEPLNLPILTLEKALRGNSGGEKGVIGDFTIPDSVKLRLKEVFEKDIKFAKIGT